MVDSPIQLSKNSLRAEKYDRHAFRSVARNPIYLVLDGLTCQHNIGSILRMADAALVKKVFLCGNNEMPLSRKLRKGSRGAEKWVDWECQPQVQNVLVTLKANGVTIVAVELCDRSMMYTDLDATSPVCFVLGGERHGVSQTALAEADHAIHLPMLGMMNSLNVATAASVVLYNHLAKLMAAAEGKP